MNIEEAKANIGKEVVYIGSINQILNGLSGETFLITGIQDDNLIIVESKDFIFAVEPQHLQLKHPTYKVGDQVVLDESTKPYTFTFTSGNSKIAERVGCLSGKRTYTIIGIGDDGDVHLDDNGWIQPRHLKLAPQGEIELPEFHFTEEDFKKFSMPCTPKKLEPEYHPRLKDVTNLLQALDVAFSVEENDFVFTVKFADTSFQVMKNDYEALRYAEALLIAEKLDKTAEFDVLMADKIKAVVLLQSHGFNAKINMRGIEVV